VTTQDELENSLMHRRDERAKKYRRFPRKWAGDDGTRRCRESSASVSLTEPLMIPGAEMCKDLQQRAIHAGRPLIR
jgi:hypothetical protein